MSPGATAAASGQSSASESFCPWWGPSGRSRLAFVDWLRGVACIIMLQAHVFESFARPVPGDHSVTTISKLIGGIAAPIFLFLVGMTLAFKIGRCELQGLSARTALGAALSRAFYLAAVAYAFRIQRWIFSWPEGRWTFILHPGVLNCMAAGTVLLAFSALLSPGKRIRYCAWAGLVLAASVPLISTIEWSSVHLLVRLYLMPSTSSVGFFPSATYIPLGMSLGTILWHTPMQTIDQAVRWVACFGFAIVLACLYLPTFPHWLFSNADYGRDSPLSVLLRVGIVLILLAFAAILTTWQRGPRLGLVRTLGSNSLLVYWVHSELIYGRWFAFLKERLSFAQTCLAAAVLVLLMYCLASLNLPERIRKCFGRLRHQRRAATTA